MLRLGLIRGDRNHGHRLAVMDRFALALLCVACAGPVMAQGKPEETATYRVVSREGDILHSWRATLDYGQAAGPIEDAGSRVGYSRKHEAKVGLDFAVGDRGFGRFEALTATRHTKRTLTFDDLDGDEDETGLGVTGGIYLLRFLAAGLSFQYRWGDGEDVFTNRAIGSAVTVGRDDRLHRLAPFVMLTAPFGPVRGTLIGAYVDLRTDTDYTNAPITSDSGRVRAGVLDAALAWRVVPEIEIEGSVGWTHVGSQRVQADALPLDTDTGAVGARLTYSLSEALDATLRGSQDFANDRGNGFRFGGGLAYRF